MDKSVKKVRINIPMVLTWTRIALIPLIVGVFMIPTSVLSMHSQNLLGCIFFIVAAVTDALDGFIARRYGMGTTLGAFLDPVADKLMVSAALIVLLAFGRVDMLVALVIIGREITVSALREWMARVGESGKVKVNWFGKIKAIAQMVSIPMLLYFDPIGAWNVYLTGTILIYIAAILTIYSMFVYLKAAA
ncbi:CDP-diacylglycerol--glycerol-3-phosphate 3-phosphatidyltransferase, partial [Parasutterella excrementihominis]